MLIASNYHETRKHEGRLNGVQQSSKLEMARVFHVRRRHRIIERVKPAARLRLLKVCCCSQIQGAEAP